MPAPKSFVMSRVNERVRDVVRAKYADIATGRQSSCCCCCCDENKGANHANMGRLAKSLGYNKKDIANLPKGANMGLSCGNPVAIAALRAGQVVLDLGSGGGFDAFQAGVKVKKSGRVIGVDMTPEMISKARKNVEHYRKRTGLDNVEFRLGKIEYLPVPDSSVDVVLSNCVINLSPSKQQIWNDVFRVLKSGGKVSVSDLALLKPLPKKVRGMVAALVGCIAGAVLVDETDAMLKKAGFSAIKLTPKPDYIRDMQACNDSLFGEIVAALPKGNELADYVVSMSIEASKN